MTNNNEENFNQGYSESEAEKKIDLIIKISQSKDSRTDKPIYSGLSLLSDMEKLFFKAFLQNPHASIKDLKTPNYDFSNENAAAVWKFLSRLYGSKVSKSFLESEGIQKIINAIIKKHELGEPSILANENWKKYVRDRCGDLDLLGLGKKPIRDFYIEPILKSVNDLSKNNDGLYDFKSELRKKSAKIQIFGKSGIGKTSLLKSLALSCIDKLIKEDHVPIYISFKRLRSKHSEPLDDLLSTYKKIIDQDICKVDFDEIQEALEKGRALLLLDGFDLNENINPSEVTLFEEFVKKYSGNSFVIVSKTRDIIGGDYLKDFQEFELEGFDIDLAIKFVKRLNDGLEDSPLARDLANTENTLLREIATTTSPLILSCLSLVYSKFGMDQPMYHDEDWLFLYQNSMSHLLEWDAERSNTKSHIYKSLSKNQRANLISYLGIKLMEEGTSGRYLPKNSITKLITEYLSRSDIQIDKEILDSSELLDAIEYQDGIVVQKIRDRDDYGFVHDKLREYFASLYLSNASVEEWEYYLDKFASEASWNEIIQKAFRLRQLATERIFNEITLRGQKSNEKLESRVPELSISITRFCDETQVHICKKSIDHEPILEVWKFRPQDSEEAGLFIFEQKDHTLFARESSQVFSQVSSTSTNEWLNGANIKQLIPVLHKIFSAMNTQR